MTEGARPHDEGRLAAGIDLFNKGYFFEAHDVWEEIWTADRTPSRKFYQGLIKIAGGFYHWQLAEYDSGIHLLTAGLEHLVPFAEDHEGLDIARLRRETTAELEKIERLEAGTSDSDDVQPPKIHRAP